MDKLQRIAMSYNATIKVACAYTPLTEAICVEASGKQYTYRQPFQIARRGPPEFKFDLDRR